MNKELVKQMIDYVKDMEGTVDSEWGSSRDVDQLVKDSCMPEIYYQLLTEYNGFLTEV